MQEHLRHADIQTTTVYTRLTLSDSQEVISQFDKNNGDENRDSRPCPPAAPKLWGGHFSTIGVVAPTGYDRLWHV